MRVELKGLIAALLAGLAVVGGTFGVSSLVVKAQVSQASSKAASLTQSAQAPGAGAQVVNAAFVAQGHALYTQGCTGCHGVNAVGGYGPNLHHSDQSDAKITLTIKNGVKGKMPAFGGKYNDQQTQTLVAYIDSLK